MPQYGLSEGDGGDGRVTKNMTSCIGQPEGRLSWRENESNNLTSSPQSCMKRNGGKKGSVLVEQWDLDLWGKWRLESTGQGVNADS